MNNKLNLLMILSCLLIIGCSSENKNAKGKNPQLSSEPLERTDPYSAPLYPAKQEAKAQDFTIDLLSGESFQLSRQKDKVVIMNIWATWCAPCHDETPDFVDLYDKYKDQGLVILGVSIDEQGKSVVQPFMEKYNVNYPMVIDDGSIMDKYGPTMGIPTTYIINKKGNLQYFAVGALTQKELEPKLVKLLNEQPDNLIHQTTKNNRRFLAWLNAWIIYRGAARYNELTDHYKRKLFSNLSGKVLEIGAGTGANLDYYPTDIELVVLEPSPYMQRYFKQKVEDTGLSAEIHTGVAEQIPFPDQSFDSVISTLVLCSVDDLRQSLSEISRVLKPGGTFYFIEHIAASDDTWLRTLQNWITPFWKRVTDGCHPNRETDEIIRQSGFTDIKMEQTRVKLPVVSPHIIGSAAKPR